MQRIAILWGLTLISMACQRTHLETRVWSETAPAEVPSQVPKAAQEWAEDTDFQEIQKQIQIGSETITRKVQMARGIPIEDSLLTDIRNHSRKTPEEPDGHRVWVAQKKLRAPLSWLPRAHLMAYHLRTEKIHARIEQSLKNEGLEPDGQPRLVLSQRQGQYAPELKVNHSRKLSGDFFLDSYDLRGRRIDRQAVGFSFQVQSRLAQIFPLGPKKSQLAWVPLFVLETGSDPSSQLSSAYFSLSSRSGQKVSLNQPRLAFALNDVRFDQIQVYYFIENFLDGLKVRHGFELPLPLKVETHIGYPEASNAAFYYQQVLRFGSGDGTTYLDLMRDPTIVAHEVGHAVIDALTHLPFSGEGGSISEAFADFFAASSLNTPRMAEDSYIPGPYRRNLENKKSFDQKQGKLYADSEIVSGLLWQLHQSWGQQKSEEFALRLLARLLPTAGLEDLKTLILELSSTLPASEQETLESILLERKWK